MNEQDIFNSNPNQNFSAGNPVGQPDFMPAQDDFVPLQKKSNPLPVVLAVIAVALVGFGVWRLIDANKAKELAEEKPEVVNLDLTPAVPVATRPAVVTTTTDTDNTETTDETQAETAASTTTTKGGVVSPAVRTNLTATPVPTPVPTTRTTTTTVVEEKVVTINRKKDWQREWKDWNYTPRLETCGERRDNNKWNASFYLPEVKDADDYLVIVGTENGSNNVTERHLQGRNAQVLTLEIENDRTYYVRYKVRINGNYTDWSATLETRCNDNNGGYWYWDNWHYVDNGNSGYYGNFKGFKCVKDSHTCESTNDDNPPFPNSEDGLQRCAQECR